MKKENIYMGFGVLGSAVHFKKVSGYNGTADTLATIKILLANPSITKLGLFSRNDWEGLSDAEKLEVDPRSKIYNPWKDLPSLGKVIKEHGESLESQRKFVEELTNAERDNPPDFMIAYMSMGMMTSSTIPLFLRKRRDPGWPKILMSTISYASPLNYYISETQIPWLMLGTDPRYFPKRMSNRDCYNMPLEVLGQYESEHRWEHIDIDKKTEIFDSIKMHYAEVEKHRIFEEKIIPGNTERPYKFTVVAMQSSPAAATKDERFTAINDWVLRNDVNKECNVYGKWSEYFSSQYPTQFKGLVNLPTLDEIMKKTRYTLIVPVRPNWVTYKYAEMLKNGVLPFFHPSYDTQNHIIPKDHPMRVRSSKEMFEKMEEFDNDPKKRYNILVEMQNDLIVPAVKGDYFYKILNDSFNRHSIELELSEHQHSKIRRTRLVQTSLF